MRWPTNTRTRGACLAVVVGIALAVPSAAGAATFGANVNGLFWPGRPPAPNALQVLLALHSIGGTVARTDTYWQETEPSPPVNGVHTYNWTYDDTVAAYLAYAGLRWQPIIDYSTSWAAVPNGGVNAGVDPSHIGDYAAFAAAFAARYGPGGTFWAEHPHIKQLPVEVYEIWNEEDLNEFWGPEPNLPEYGQLYLAARSAIKAIQPTAKVIIGGMVRATYSLPEMFAADPGLKGNVDGIAIHPYRKNFDLSVSAVNLVLTYDAQTARAPVYVNEYGWRPDPTLFQGTTEALRDRYTARFTEWLARNPFVADIEPYTWGTSPSWGYLADVWNMYDTPAEFAYAVGIAAAEGRAHTQSATTGSNGGHQRHRRHRKHRRRHRKHHHRHHRRRHHHHRHTYPITKQLLFP